MNQLNWVFGVGYFCNAFVFKIVYFCCSPKYNAVDCRVGYIVMHHLFVYFSEVGL